MPSGTAKRKCPGLKDRQGSGSCEYDDFCVSRPNGSYVNKAGQRIAKLRHEPYCREHLNEIRRRKRQKATAPSVSLRPKQTEAVKALSSQVRNLEQKVATMGEQLQLRSQNTRALRQRNKRLSDDRALKAAAAAIALQNLAESEQKTQELQSQLKTVVKEKSSLLKDLKEVSFKLNTERSLREIDQAAAQKRDLHIQRQRAHVQKLAQQYRQACAHVRQVQQEHHNLEQDLERAENALELLEQAHPTPRAAKAKVIHVTYACSL